MSTNNSLDLQYRYFVVNEKPFCVWDADIQKRTLDFLESIDPSYFEYIANTHIQNIDVGDEAKSKESQHAALVIRTTYSQALEALFALIAAALQAPLCIPAWINLYRNEDLRSVVHKIDHYKPLLSQTVSQVLRWSSISEIIFASLVLEDKEKETAIKSGFAQLWSRFATDFLNEEFTKEYNSIKHGLRVRPGGFYLAIGIQDDPNVPAPREKMRLFGKSGFGSSYIAAEKIGDLSHHIRMKRHRRNWNPEDIAWGLHLASMSISNIQSALKIINGVPAEQVQFSWPTDLSMFQEPWKRSAQMGVTSMTGIDITIQHEFIRPFTKEIILANYKAGKYDGIQRIIFGSESSVENDSEHSDEAAS